jgi:hypothetical protein
MVAPLTLPRNAEGAQSEGRVAQQEGKENRRQVEQRGQQHTLYEGQGPLGPQPTRLGYYSSSTKVTSRLTL